MKLFSYDFGKFIFRYLKYPRNRALMKEGITMSEAPSTYAF